MIRDPAEVNEILDDLVIGDSNQGVFLYVKATMKLVMQTRSRAET
jgi:hypothetical protein